MYERMDGASPALGTGIALTLLVIEKLTSLTISHLPPKKAKKRHTDAQRQKNNEERLLQTPGIEPGTFCEPKHMCCNAVLDRNHNR